MCVKKSVLCVCVCFIPNGAATERQSNTTETRCGIIIIIVVRGVEKEQKT